VQECNLFYAPRNNDLAQLANALPSGLKQRGRTGTWVFKKAIEPYLPLDVIDRPKTGFGAPLRRWLRHELRPLMNEVLSAASMRRRGLFDADGVARLVRADRDGRSDEAYTIFAVVCIEVWCRMFLDKGV
jgi:asparagine synthase (glutamine-hydrolysing)